MKLHGGSMEFHGVSMGLHGSSVEVPWRFHGRSMEFQRGVP